MKNGLLLFFRPTIILVLLLVPFSCSNEPANGSDTEQEATATPSFEQKGAVRQPIERFIPMGYEQVKGSVTLHDLNKDGEFDGIMWVRDSIGRQEIALFEGKPDGTYQLAWMSSGCMDQEENSPELLMVEELIVLRGQKGRVSEDLKFIYREKKGDYMLVGRERQERDASGMVVYKESVNYPQEVKFITRTRIETKMEGGKGRPRQESEVVSVADRGLSLREVGCGLFTLED